MGSIVSSKVFKKYFVPGIVFQSCVIAGGYGTGRELIEYFMGYGPTGGLLAMILVSMVSWSLIAGVTFAFAVKFKTYDYKTFMIKLVGPIGWILYEIAYVVLLMVILAVVAASSGSILQELFGLNIWVGTILMSVAVYVLVIKGTDAIEKVLSYWSFLLYGVYFLFMVLVFMNFGGEIAANFASMPVTGNWVAGGFQYGFYNLCVIVAVLYSLEHCETPKEGFISGLCAGVIGILPAIILFVAMCGFAAEIVDQTLPIDYILAQMNMPWLRYIFQIVLFGTLIETGSGLIFAITNRFEIAYKVKGKDAPKWLTPVFTLALLVVAIGVSTFGLISLIAVGYGAAAYVFFFVYALPVLVLGTKKLLKG